MNRNNINNMNQMNQMNNNMNNMNNMNNNMMNGRVLSSNELPDTIIKEVASTCEGFKNFAKAWAYWVSSFGATRQNVKKNVSLSSLCNYCCGEEDYFSYIFVFNNFKYMSLYNFIRSNLLVTPGSFELNGCNNIHVQFAPFLRDFVRELNVYYKSHNVWGQILFNSNK